MSNLFDSVLDNKFKLLALGSAVLFGGLGYTLYKNYE